MKHILYTIPFLFFLTGLNAQRASTELSLARFYLTAAASGDKVMFAGGGTRGFLPSTVVDLYDVKTGQWEQSQLSAPRHGPAAVAAGQKIYVAGGSNLKTKEESGVIDIYDVPTKTWTTALLSQARHNIMAVAVGNKILFAGGGVGSPGIPLTAPSDVVDIYDTSTKVWSVQKLSLPRDYMGSAVSGSKAYFAGGLGFDGKSTTRIDVYDASDNSWDTLSLPVARFAVSVAAAGNKIMFAGGQTENNEYVKRVDIWDAVNRVWSAAELSAPRVWMTTGTLCGKVIFAGGGTFNWDNKFINAASDAVDIFDLKTQTWTTDQLSFTGCGGAGAVSGNQFMTGGGWTPPSIFNQKVDIFTCADLNKK